MNKPKLTFIVICLFILPLQFARAEFELAPKYTIFFTEQQVYQGAGLELRIPNADLFDFGFFVQGLGATKGVKGYLFDIGLFPRFKYVYDTVDLKFEFYCTVPLGATYGSHQSVVASGITYPGVNYIPSAGMLIGLLPGVSFGIGQHWSIFTELGFNYRYLVPSSIRFDAAGSKSIKPDNIHMLGGVWNVGVAFRF
ncbi:MAG: hypothetical protein V4534_00090 [Myxococcota bacterium]